MTLTAVATGITKELLADLRGLFPPQLIEQDKVWIAGGYAAAPDSARDIDVWVLTGDLYVNDIRRRLGKTPLDIEQMSPAEEALYAEAGFQLVAEIDAHRYVPNTPPMPMQILATKHVTIEGLLRVFDLGVHRAAVSLKTGQFVCFEFTPPHLATEVGSDEDRPTHALRSVERMEKACVRYGLPADMADRDRLIALSQRMTAAPIDDCPF